MKETCTFVVVVVAADHMHLLVDHQQFVERGNILSSSYPASFVGAGADMLLLCARLDVRLCASAKLVSPGSYRSHQLHEKYLYVFRVSARSRVF